ncbi:DUF6479 family protein [Streptomyces sp. 6-11-2]|uniref:DUF6479 family protein n=1 Tax=Streptomyces sp. 6-11-2 TaxID=2585753 RepID=UPI00280BC641|nr:DUF6479 family protein [Streptomyces sp. 6-11-2]
MRMFRTYRSSAARLPPCSAAGSAPRPRRLGTHRPGGAGCAPARDTTSYDAAGAGSAAGIAVIVVGGPVIAAVLVRTVPLGSRVKQGEPRTPRGGEHPTLPESGPVHEVRRRREPAEVPRAEETGRRPTPRELGSSGSRRGEDRIRPRWDGAPAARSAVGAPAAGDQGPGCRSGVCRGCSRGLGTFGARRSGGSRSAAPDAEGR